MTIQFYVVITFNIINPYVKKVKLIMSFYSNDLISLSYVLLKC